MVNMQNNCKGKYIMKKLLFIIIMLFVFSGTASAELNNSIATPEKLKNSQEKGSVKARNIKRHNKATQLRSKLAMLLVLGNAAKNSHARPYVSQN